MSCNSDVGIEELMVSKWGQASCDDKLRVSRSNQRLVSCLACIRMHFSNCHGCDTFGPQALDKASKASVVVDNVRCCKSEAIPETTQWFHLHATLTPSTANFESLA